MEWLMTGIIVFACIGDVLITRYYAKSMKQYSQEMQNSNQTVTYILDEAMAYFKEATMTRIVVPKSKDKV